MSAGLPKHETIVQSVFTRRNPEPISTIFLPTSRATKIKRFLHKWMGSLFFWQGRVSVGVDIRHGVIKILQLERDVDGEITIKRRAAKDLPRGCKTETPEWRKIVGQELKKLVVANGIKGACYALVPLATLKMKQVVLPVQDAREAEQAIRWEVKQMMDRKSEVLTWDYVLLTRSDAAGGGAGMKAWIVAAETQEIIDQVDVLKSAGLTPLSLDKDVFANGAILEYSRHFAVRETILLLDFGMEKTGLSLVVQGELALYKELNTTGHTLTTDLAEYYQWSYAEAKALKEQFGLEGPSAEMLPDAEQVSRAGQVKNVLLVNLENFVQDLELVIKSISLQPAGPGRDAVSRIVLCGEESGLKGLVPYLSGRMNKPVEMLNVRGTGIAPGFHAAMGVALRRWHRARRINLLTCSPLIQALIDGVPGLVRNRFAVLMVVVALVLGGLVLWQKTEENYYKARIEKTRADMALWQSQQEKASQAMDEISLTREEMERDMGQMKANLVIFEEILSGRVAWAKVLSSIGGVIPQELWLQRVSLNKRSVVITGAGFDNAVVLDLMKRLERSGAFEQVGFNYLRKVMLAERPAVSFEITAKVVVQSYGK